MKPRVGKKEQAEITHRKILDAAIALFSHRGFSSTSMSDLAKAIGMTSGVLYWHFKNKEALLVAALGELQRRLAVELLAVESTSSPDTATLVEQMIGRVAQVVEHHQDYMLFVGVVTAEVTDSNPRVERALRQAYRGIAQVVASLFERGGREGLVEPDLDLECAAQLFLGLYMGGIMHQRLFRDQLPLVRALPVLERLLLGAALPAVRTARFKRRRSR